MTDSSGASQISRLDVDVDSAPIPGLIRPSIEAALAGRALGAGPEAALGHAVATAVTVSAASARGGATPC